MDIRKDYKILTDEEIENLSVDELKELRDDLEKERAFDEKREKEIDIHNAWDVYKYEEAYGDTKYDEEQLQKLDSDISKKQQ